MCQLFLYGHCFSGPLFLCATVPLCHCVCAHFPSVSVPTVHLCPMSNCVSCSSGRTVFLFLCAHCPFATIVRLCPLFFLAHSFSVSGTVSLCPLFLCVHCFSVSTVSLYPLFLCAHCFSVSTVSVFTVSLCPLFLCVPCFSVSIVPLWALFLCVHCFSVSTVSLCPLFLYVHCFSVSTVFLWPLTRASKSPMVTSFSVRGTEASSFSKNMSVTSY